MQTEIKFLRRLTEEHLKLVKKTMPARTQLQFLNNNTIRKPLKTIK